MNEKSCFNEAVFVFAVQSCFWKVLNFLTQALGSSMVARPRHGSGILKRAGLVWLLGPGAGLAYPDEHVCHSCQTQVLGFRPNWLRSGNHTKPKRHEFDNHAIPKTCVGLQFIPDPRCVGMTNMSDLTNNKQRERLCTLVVKREKRKKKCKQSITDSNSTIICLHVPHHVKEDMTVHLVRR